MDLITLLTHHPLAALAAVAALYMLVHVTVIRGLMGPRAGAGRPSRWRIRPSQEAAGEADRTGWDVVLESAGERKLDVLKELREITGLGLKEAKDLLESAPALVTRSEDRAEAEGHAERLRREGALAAVAQAGASRVGPRHAFEVVLEDAGDRPIDTIRLVRGLSRGGLKESKELVETVPQRVLTLESREEAESVRARLEREGASVSLEA